MKAHHSYRLTVTLPTLQQINTHTHTSSCKLFWNFAPCNFKLYFETLQRVWYLRSDQRISFFQREYKGVSKSFRTELIKKYMLRKLSTCFEAKQRVMAANLTWLNTEIYTQMHVVAESCTVCSSSSRRPVRKLLDTPTYCEMFVSLRTMTFVVLTRSLENVYKMSWHWMWLVISSLGFFSEINKRINLVYWIHRTIWVFNPMDKMQHLLRTCPHFCKNCDSSVGIATRLRAGRSGV
jgi:hypothetical protein